MKEMLPLKQGLCLVLLIGLVNCLTYSIDSESANPLSIVSDKFLSVTLDISDVVDCNISHPHFRQLVKYLSPMYFRIGGTLADTNNFEDDTKANNKVSKYGDSIMTGSYWLKLHEFSKDVNVRLIYDLNSLTREDGGPWNSENAEEMIAFSQKHGIELDWELGNEPDLYYAIYKKNVAASQLATDYNNLRSILNKYELYNSSKLVGPSMFDVGSSDATKSYLRNFLSDASSSVDAVTWHQYYFAGKDATEQLFLDPATFNYLEQRAKVVTDIVGTTNKVWLGETSSAYNGGAYNKSDTYLATFLWLDKLGLGAKLGLDVVLRQEIWGNNYSLVDRDFTPNPDWWVSVFYRKLVGTKVISLTNDGGDERTIRVYAHCAKNNSLWGDSAVVVFGFNVEDKEASFSLAGLQADSQVYAYILTSESSLYSKSVRLNGEVLVLTDDYELPNLDPKIIESSDSYTLPAHSLGFYVFSNTNVKACQ